MVNVIKSFIVEEEGAEIAEYALLVVILALGLLSAAPAFQTALTAAFTNTDTKIQNGANNLGKLP
jgi:Flp pilus assembly pilin Flp